MLMRKSDPHSSATPTIQVIERMFALIDVLAQREDLMSLKEIAEKTGLHPSTAHRILNDLAIGRFVERAQPGSYRLGMRLLELGKDLGIKPHGLQTLLQLRLEKGHIIVGQDTDGSITPFEFWST